MSLASQISARRSRLVPLAALLAACSANAADWSGIPGRDNRGTVLVRINWADNNGPQGGTASGFVLTAEGHILTVAHIVPTGNTSVVLYTGETEGWASAYQRQSFSLKLKGIDRQADWALLVPTKAVQLTPVPVSWSWVPAENAAVNTRGFPLGGPLEGMPGTIRRTGSSPEVPMSMLLRAGFSGSPVYDAAGNVVCMVRGGTPVADLKDPTVMGLGFCVPLALLKPKLPPEVLVSASAAAPAVSASLGSEVRVSYSMNSTKSTPFSGPQDLGRPSTTQSYSHRFEANSGYRIVKYDYIEHSATKVSGLKIAVTPDGRFIDVNYDLTSGPGFDRWRGWLAATITTIQVSKENR